jgi:hypothetical protein
VSLLVSAASCSHRVLALSLICRRPPTPWYNNSRTSRATITSPLIILRPSPPPFTHVAPVTTANRDRDRARNHWHFRRQHSPVEEHCIPPFHPHNNAARNLFPTSLRAQESSLPLRILHTARLYARRKEKEVILITNQRPDARPYHELRTSSPSGNRAKLCHMWSIEACAL